MENRAKFLKLLGAAFEVEYNAVFLYLREAELFRKKLVEGEELGRIFSDFSLMELRHADRIASRLIELGEKPEWKFREMKRSDSLREVLREHAAGESAAINLYEDFINACAEADFKLILKGIWTDEREHLDKINRILKHLSA